MSSSGFTVSKDGKKLETATKVEYKILATPKKVDLLVLVERNEPGSYNVWGDLTNQSFEGFHPASQKKVEKGIDEEVDLLMKPTIVHQSFETVPVLVPPPAPMFIQPPPMMEPPAPLKIFLPSPPFQ